MKKFLFASLMAFMAQNAFAHYTCHNSDSKLVVEELAQGPNGTEVVVHFSGKLGTFDLSGTGTFKSPEDQYPALFGKDEVILPGYGVLTVSTKPQQCGRVLCDPGKKDFLGKLVLEKDPQKPLYFSCV